VTDDTLLKAAFKINVSNVLDKASQHTSWSHHLHAVHRCGLLLQMLQLVCVLGTLVAVQTRLNQSRCMGADWCGTKEPLLDGWEIPHGKGHFWGGDIVLAYSIIPMHAEWQWMCLPSTCGGHMHSLTQGAKRQWCGLLPNYFAHFLE